MARGGITTVLVRKARDALLARGQNPSIDSVRIELGNTGSKTTIQRLLKEIEANDPRPMHCHSRMSDELTELVGRMLQRMIEESNEVLARERIGFEHERAQLTSDMDAITVQLKIARDESAAMMLTVKNQEVEIKSTLSSFHSEVAKNERISQSCSDLELRVREKDDQIQSLEEKHMHVREALEHYRAAVKEQRDQDLRRHESQLNQMQQELSVLQQTLMVKQDEVTRFIRDNERLLSENRQISKKATQHHDDAESLRVALDIANSATSRAEGAKELLQLQLEAKSREAIEAHSEATLGQGREAALLQQLKQAQAQIEVSRKASGNDHLTE